MPELLGGPRLVTRPAQAPDIAVVVATAFAEWHDMVWDGRRSDDAAFFAVTTKRLGLQSAAALSHASPAAKAFGHMANSRYRNARSVF